MFPTKKARENLSPFDKNFQTLYPLKCHPRLFNLEKKIPNSGPKKNSLETVIVSLVLDCCASWKTEHLGEKLLICRQELFHRREEKF